MTHSDKPEPGTYRDKVTGDVFVVDRVTDQHAHGVFIERMGVAGWLTEVGAIHLDAFRDNFECAVGNKPDETNDS